MGTEVLRPQDCLIQGIRVAPVVFPRRKNYYGNGIPKVNNVSRKPMVKSARPEHRRRSPEPTISKRSASDDELRYKQTQDGNNTNNNSLVLGQVTILKRGESLDTKSKVSQANNREEMTVYGATVPGPLIWEIVKKNNSFLVKEFGNGTASVRFSKETNNLFNLNSYKHSGLANHKTVTIQPGAKDSSILLATTKTKRQNKPAALFHKSLLKKEFPRMAKTVTNQVADNYYRPDLKHAALARLSAVNRSLKVAKSGVKKRNRQATRTRSRK